MIFSNFLKKLIVQKFKGIWNVVLLLIQNLVFTGFCFTHGWSLFQRSFTCFWLNLVPCRNERCVFVLRPVTHTVGDFVEMLRQEDAGIDRVVVRNHAGEQIIDSHAHLKKCYLHNIQILRRSDRVNDCCSTPSWGALLPTDHQRPSVRGRAFHHGTAPALTHRPRDDRTPSRRTSARQRRQVIHRKAVRGISAYECN